MIFPRRKSEVCPWWLAYTFDNPLRRFLHDPGKILAPFVREGMTVADIGCGMGYFSVAMAKMVGPAGSVLAVDLQPQMLAFMHKRAVRAGVEKRIKAVLAGERDIGVDGTVDFILLFWMAHEVKDSARFFSQVSAILRLGGQVLYVEPKMHVSGTLFRTILTFATGAGFEIRPAPHVRLSRTALLVKARDAAR